MENHSYVAIDLCFRVFPGITSANSPEFTKPSKPIVFLEATLTTAAQFLLLIQFPHVKSATLDVSDVRITSCQQMSLIIIPSPYKIKRPIYGVPTVWKFPTKKKHGVYQGVGRSSPWGPVPWVLWVLRIWPCFEALQGKYSSSFPLRPRFIRFIRFIILSRHRDELLAILECHILGSVNEEVFMNSLLFPPKLPF